MAYGYQTEEDVAPAYGVNPEDLPLRPPIKKPPLLAMPAPSPETVANQPQPGMLTAPVGPQIGQTDSGGDTAAIAPAGNVTPIGPRTGAPTQLGQQEAALKRPELHGWKKALDIIGQIAAPGVEMAIPGSLGNYRVRVGEARAADSQAAKLQEDQARLGQTQADTERATVETDLARNPKPKMQEIAGAAGPNGEILFRDETGRTPGVFVMGPNGFQPAGQQVTGQTGGQPGALTNQSPEKIRVAPEKVQSFANDVKAGFPTLTKGQVGALVSQLGPTPTQADMAKVQANAEKYSQANLQAQATQTNRDQVQQDRQANTDLRRQAEDQKKAEKAKIVGWAFNPKTKEKVLTNQDEADRNGYQDFLKVNSTEKQESSLAAMNDVQMNLSYYRNAVNALPPEGISMRTVAGINAIISDKDLNIRIGEGGLLPGMATDVLQQGVNAKIWNALSKPEQDVVTGYLAAKSSVAAYQKALTDAAPRNKELMQIEMNTLPSPVVGATVANPRLDRFQNNIDVASEKFGKIPWMESPKDIRGRIEKSTSGGGGKDFGPAQGKPEGATGTLPDGTKIIVKGGRITSR